MRIFRLPAIAVGLFAVVASAAAARADDWMLAKASGDVRVTGLAAQPVSVGNGAMVRSGQTLTTGRNGRALLVHGKDAVNVGPGSTIEVPAVNAVITTLVEIAGTIELDIEK